MNETLLKNIDMMRAYLRGASVEMRESESSGWRPVGLFTNSGVGVLFGNPQVEFRLAPVPFRRIVNEYRYENHRPGDSQYAYYTTEEEAFKHRAGPYYYRTFVVEEKL